ncbi:hypothetical protein BJ138DRAFT_181684 [Hygrophoropsis aurantiaca]|uniref:Uncharacterized protein n=1 Tax=Hygrophoropsis aurantiaca TaxID=72124 RepID=A0ACB7ZQX9_9AGAM|nr:hypothetical protein BJ138DRAFT_181684 [Hygrophoropsis aurantiaca]
MADSALTVPELQAAQTTNYVAVAAGALVAYDQVLTFSQEFDHIWNRQWNFTTALYLVARNFGSLSVIGIAALWICINWTYSVNVNMFLAVTWAENIFLLTMQAILVIRVYALFNRSRRVLVFLATFYALQTTATFVMTALLFNNRALHEYIGSVSPAIGSVTQAVNTNASPFLPIAQDSTVVSVVFNTVLLFFALWAFVRHALEARAMDGGWSINVLVRTLVADHLVYFVCSLTWLSLTLAVDYATEPELNVSVILLNDAASAFTALTVVAGPRMVISLRAVENKARREGVILGGSLSTIRFAIQEPPTQSERVTEIRGATDEDGEYE